MGSSEARTDDANGLGSGKSAVERRAAMVHAAKATLPGDVRAPPPGAAVHMTERQLYAFRQQIAAYAHICQQLLQITTVSATQQTPRQREMRHEVPGATGANWGASVPVTAPASAPLSSSNHSSGKTRGEDKQARGPRWTGTPTQYEILEDLFQKGEQPPVRDRLTELTEMLKQHGPVQESNVYNWFQNRRSREKKLQAMATGH